MSYLKHMKALALFVALAGAAAFIACSDDEQRSGEPKGCPLMGSYSLRMPAFGCPYSDAGDRVDILRADETHYRADVRGLGSCEMVKTDPCRLYGACDVSVGHVQIGWAFDEYGFSGTTYAMSPELSVDCERGSLQLAIRIPAP